MSLQHTAGAPHHLVLLYCQDCIQGDSVPVKVQFFTLKATAFLDFEHWNIFQTLATGVTDDSRSDSDSADDEQEEEEDEDQNKKKQWN